jgi:hypothetical protein
MRVNAAFEGPAMSECRYLIFPIILFATAIVISGQSPAPLVADGDSKSLRKSDKTKPAVQVLLKPEALRIGASKPVTVNGAKFVAVAQSRWQLGKKGKSVAIDIQLQITNLAKTDVIFPTFDSFGLVMCNQQGNMIEQRGGRLATRLTQPILLPSGVTYSLAADGTSFLDRRRSELSWNETHRGCELLYSDGTGWASRFGPLDPGTYQLAFWYAVRPEIEERDEGRPAVWSGKVRTEWAVIEVVGP